MRRGGGGIWTTSGSYKSIEGDEYSMAVENYMNSYYKITEVELNR